MQRTPDRIIRLPLIISVSLAIGMVAGYFYSIRSSVNIDRSSKLFTILQYIEKFYVDSVSLDSLAEASIPQILHNLDPHSSYLPAEEAERENEPLEGGFSGIGIQFNMDKDTVVVVKTIPNGPSEKKGILPGDRIIAVNGQTVAGVNMPSDSIVKRLKGPRGTAVKVTIKRPRISRPLEFTLIRDNIPLYSIDIAYMVAPSIGYVKINQFARNTPEEFINAVNRLKSRGMKKIIVDLRGNGGGYMDAAIRLADQFLENGKLIVYTIGRSKKKEDMAFATYEGIAEKEEVAVLIDEYSASASEIFAGAIQDNDRGIIIGRRSFGKALVQKPILLDDNSVIRLTIARYYTPTGRCIQKPYRKGDEEYYFDLLKRYEKGEFSSADSIHYNDTTKYYTPAGKVVYGGGGIMPDIFVPIEKENTNEYFLKIQANGFIYSFSFEYTDKNRSRMQSLKTVSSIKAWLDSMNVMKEFSAYVSQKGMPLPSSLSPEIKHRIKTQLYAYIARNLIDNEGFYPILSETDNTLQTAINYLSNH